jgi:hypothetical protein
MFIVRDAVSAGAELFIFIFRPKSKDFKGGVLKNFIRGSRVILIKVNVVHNLLKGVGVVNFDNRAIRFSTFRADSRADAFSLISISHREPRESGAEV